MIFNSFFIILLKLLKDTQKTAFGLFKIMIPISILVKGMEYFGFIAVLGNILKPIMKIMGLPGEIGIVWATTMISNIYGGMLVYAEMYKILQLTEAQITIMCGLMLVAHTLPVELRVAQKAGCHIFTMFFIRFGFAILSGIVMNLLFSYFNILQNSGPSEVALIHKMPVNTVPDWLLQELQFYLKVTFYVFCLLSLMQILKTIGIIELISRILHPILSTLGISKAVIPITVIGSTLGILYGGALIIKESEEKELRKMDVFYAMTLMGLCHSLIEDSILMMSLGASILGVFVFRMCFAYLITLIIVKISKKLPQKLQEKILTSVT